jgi:hypothetical protein
MLESKLYFFFAICCLILTVRLDKSEGKVLSVMAMPTFAALSIFPIYAYSKESLNIQQFDHYVMTNISWFWLIVIMLSLPLAFSLSFFKIKKEAHLYTYSRMRLDRAFYICSILSILGFFINLNNVNFDISLLFTSPRLYEKSFGRYWVINYLYFLHIPALILYVYRKSNFFHRRIDKFIVIILLSSSFFHGIKYTVFDALFFPFLFFIVIKGFSELRPYFIAIVSIFILFFSLFSYFVRGGGEEFDLLAVRNYILPNYLNLFYAIEKNTLPLKLPYHVMLGFLPPVSIEEPLVGGFVLNNKYNMSTGFKQLIELFNVFGIFIFYGFVVFAYKILNRKSIFQSFILALFLFSLLMMFYSYYIGTKFKYIYLLFVIFIIDFYCKGTKRKIGSEG